MEITRQENKADDNLFDYELTEDEKKLKILLNKKGDLYWLMDDSEPSDYANFTITRENEIVYSIFDRLYSQIMEYNPKRAKAHYSLSDEAEFNNSISRMMITSNNRVNWVSDDDEFTEGDLLTIVKTQDEEIILEFFHQVTNMPFIYKPGMFDIGIKRTNSRLDPFNKLFYEMYLELQQYDPKLHQIHIEELSETDKKKTKSN